jgi:hypothetical protein
MVRTGAAVHDILDWIMASLPQRVGEVCYLQTPFSLPLPII